MINEVKESVFQIKVFCPFFAGITSVALQRYTTGIQAVYSETTNHNDDGTAVMYTH